ncbi:MAG: SPOR domain-containing protein [Povalibacter sp.]
MARDYKNTKRRTSSGSGLSGIAGFVLGLGFGLAVATGVYLYDRRPSSRLAQEAAPITRDDEPASNKPAPASSQESETQFDFYEMLPKFEVVIPEKNGSGSSGATASTTDTVQKPGAYILQAGSFRRMQDADRVRALIALQGVESKIEKVTVDNDTWHRVRIGPITNLQKLEETRSKLRQAQIEALVIKVGG